MGVYTDRNPFKIRSLFLRGPEGARLELCVARRRYPSKASLLKAAESILAGRAGILFYDDKHFCTEQVDFDGRR